MKFVATLNAIAALYFVTVFALGESWLYLAGATSAIGSSIVALIADRRRSQAGEA